MTDLKPIIDVISEEAAEKAEKLSEAARERVEQMYRDFEEEKRRKREEFEKSVSDETENMYAAQSVRQRQCIKTARLEARADAMKNAIRGACEKIAELPEEEYLQFLEKLYRKARCKGAGTVYLNERDRPRIKKGMFGGARLAEDTLPIMGGFIFAADDVEYNCTIEALCEASYSKICDSVNAVYLREEAI